MKSNKLTPNHILQLAILIVLFVIAIVTTAWIYKHQYQAVVKEEKQAITKQEVERVYGKKTDISKEERVKIESIYGN